MFLYVSKQKITVEIKVVDRHAAKSRLLFSSEFNPNVEDRGRVRNKRRANNQADTKKSQNGEQKTNTGRRQG